VEVAGVELAAVVVGQVEPVEVQEHTLVAAVVVCILVVVVARMAAVMALLVDPVV